MDRQEENQQQTGNQIMNQLKNNSDWQVGIVILLALAFLALKLFVGW